MPITRSQFRESSAIRNEIVADKVRMGTLKSDLRMIDVKPLAGVKSADNGAVLLVYKYTLDYGLEEPKNKSLGNITIKGEMIFVESSKNIDAIVKGWQKDKKLKAEFLTEALSYALRDAQIEAIEQAKKVSLPSPVPLPKIRQKPSKAA